mgnify:CR=1 FL=1|jgi:hypothetical protein
MLGDDSCLRCGIKCAVAMLTRRDSLRSVMLMALSNLPRLTTELITDYGLFYFFFLHGIRHVSVYFTTGTVVSPLPFYDSRG